MVTRDMFGKSDVYLIVMVFVVSLLTESMNDGHYSFGQNIDAQNKRQFYGCGLYLSGVHCDPLLNRIEGYAMKGSWSSVYAYGGTFVDGVQGKALSLAMDDFITGPDSASLRVDGAFSISVWIKLATTEPELDSEFAVVVDKSEGESSTNSYQMLYDVSQRRMRFGFLDGEYRTVYTDKTDWVAGQWYHVVGTYDPSISANNMRIFVDGTLNNQTTVAGSPNAPKGYVRIGALSGESPKYYWRGEIDELRIYNRSLTEDEVTGMFSKPSGSNSNGLVAYWPLDGHLDDASGNFNHGDAYGTQIVSMVFAPDGRLFFTEKNAGVVRIMKDGKVLATPFVKVSDLHTSSEQGMLGITLDPNFEENHYVYVYYTSEYADSKKPFNRVVRFTDDHDAGRDMTVIFDKITASEQGYHSGGALAFGSDEKLYVTVGDATVHESAQDPSELTGKVLRINSDGSIPGDNPFPDSPVYTIGHRNMFGIAFDRSNNIGIVTENGENFYDEVNRLEKGKNYGWPTLQPPNTPPELSDSSTRPVRSYWMVIAPAQAIYYDGERIKELKDQFLFTGFMTGNIYALQFDSDNKEVMQEEIIVLDRHPLISLAQSPDGSIYFGAYGIYKLESVDVDSKKQVLFPVEIIGPVDVKDLRLDIDAKKMVVDLRSNASPTIEIRVPKTLMDGILPDAENVVENYDVDNSSPDYNAVRFYLPSGDEYKVVIAATSVMPVITTTAIPEYLTVVLIVIAAGVIGALIIKSKYSPRSGRILKAE